MSAKTRFRHFFRRSGRQMIEVDGHNFEVIGRWPRQKDFSAQEGDEDRRVLIPYNTFRKCIPSRTRTRSRPGGCESARPWLSTKSGSVAPPPQRSLQRGTISRSDGRNAGAGVPQYRRDGCGCHGRAQLDRIAGRRRRRDEHHAGERHRAHPRDRRAQSNRRAQQRHHPGNFCSRL